jgi:hypothetical protein
LERRVYPSLLKVPHPLLKVHTRPIQVQDEADIQADMNTFEILFFKKKRNWFTGALQSTKGLKGILIPYRFKRCFNLLLILIGLLRLENYWDSFQDLKFTY